MKVRLLILVVLHLAATAVLLAFSKGPLPAHTGGFSEQTCVACHDSFSLNAGRTIGGTFHLSGVPEVYRPGATYPLVVTVGQPGQSRWGFQLTARFVRDGSQAGQLKPVDGRTQIVDFAEIQYIEHTESGTRRGLAHGPVRFEFEWTAPDPPAGSVFFNAAGNAADGSGEPKGDYVYTAGAFSHSPELPTDLQTISQQRARPERPAGPTRLAASSRLVSLPTPVDLKRGEREFLIQHRFLQPIGDAGFGNAFGIDSGANINLGFVYALTDRLSVGVSRARFFQQVGFSGTYELRTSLEQKWQMALTGGVEANSNFQRHYSPYLQWTNSIEFERLRAFVVPTLVFNSRNDAFVFPGSINPDDNSTFALGIGADFMLHPRISLTGEYVTRLAGYGSFGNDRASIGWGANIHTYGHVFSVLVGNTRHFTPSFYGVNAESTDFVLGFNIYRKF